jgi:hypothetical protein
LKILSSQIKYINNVTKKDEVWNCPYICTSLNPRTAYIYVEPMFMNDGDMPSMDLYEIDLIDTDEIILRNDNTIEIIEIRIANSIPCDRLHYVATRNNEINK